MELGAKTITAAPGTTVLLEIAIGHLNRIVTPFDSPVVHTVSTAATQVDGSAVYIATENAEPISLYIADGKDAASALSLTLAPRYVPPREIVLSVPGHRKASSSGRRTTGNDARMPVLANTAAMGCEASSPPYIAGIVEVLRGMAQGRVPTGFTVQSGSGGYKPRCANGIKLKKTQVSVGPTTSVVTAAVSNTSQGPITVDHQSCTLDGQTIAATAAWPRKELAPGEETELFLVIAQGERMVDPTGHPK